MRSIHLLRVVKLLFVPLHHELIDIGDRRPLTRTP